MNSVHIYGNITNDLEPRYTPKGDAVLNFSIAHNRKWTNDAGEKCQKTNFIECVAWGRTAETITQYLSKGSAVLIEGELEQETWTDKQTQQKRSRVHIKVSLAHFTYASIRQEHAPEPPAHHRGPQPQPPAPRFPSATARRPASPPPAREPDAFDTMTKDPGDLQDEIAF